MSIAICRCDKCSSAHDVAGMQIHDRRECEHSNSNPDIDFTRKNDNYCLCDKAITQVTDKSTGEVIREIIKSYNQVIDEQIAERYTVKKAVRKDAVRMVTFIFTSDEAFFADKSLEEQRKYFQSCLEWAENRYGKANILSAHVHMDEKTPHMHLNVIPLVKTKNKKDEEVVTLSAKAMLNGGGSKAMQALQDSFYEAVGKPYGMERGTRADLDDPNKPKPRKHQRVGEYKSITNYYQKQAEQTLNKIKHEVEALGSQKETLTSDYNALQATYNALQATLNDLNDKQHQFEEDCNRERSRLSEREQAVEEREQNIEKELTLKEKEKQYYVGLWYSAIDIAKANWDIDITEEECKAVASACCSDNSDPERPIYDYRKTTDEDIVEVLKNMDKNIDKPSR